MTDCYENIRRRTRIIRAEVPYSNHPTKASRMAQRNREYIEERERRRRMARRIKVALLRIAIAVVVVAAIYASF